MSRLWRHLTTTILPLFSPFNGIYPQPLTSVLQVNLKPKRRFVVRRICFTASLLTVKRNSAVIRVANIAFPVVT